MAINLFLNRVSKAEFLKIIKTVIYLIHRNQIISQDIVVFIHNISKGYDLSEEEFEDIFLIDARYELDFTKLIASLDKQANKMLLFFILLFATIFNKSNLQEYYEKEEILKQLPIDSTILDKINNLTKKYIEYSIKIYNYIYSKDENSSKSFLLLDIEELNLLSLQEKNSFLYTLYQFMHDDKIIAPLEAEILKIWSLYLNIDYSYFINNLHNFKANLSIKKRWVIRFLALSYLATQDDINLAASKISSYLPLKEDDLKILKKLTKNYLEIVANLYSTIFSNTLTELNEDLALTLKISFELGEIALMLIPQIKAFLTFQKFNAIRRSIGLALQSSELNTKSLDIKVVKKRINSNSLIICIDGYLSENRKNQFRDWSNSLDRYGVNATIVGLHWEASNFKKVINGGVSSWYETVHNTLKASRYLAKYISKLRHSNPRLKITLMGHSLGARVIFNTLYHLAENGTKVDQIYLFAGAKGANRLKWSDVSTAVKNNIFNFYTKHDKILNNFYRISMFNTPIGLKQLSIIKTKEHKNLTILNYNLSSIVKHHNDYKWQLDKILKRMGRRVKF